MVGTAKAAVTAPCSPNVWTAGTTVTCTPGGGTAPYTWKLGTTPYTTGVTAGTGVLVFTNLASSMDGTYTVTDSAGTPASGTVVVSVVTTTAAPTTTAAGATTTAAGATTTAAAGATTTAGVSATTPAISVLILSFLLMFVH